MLVNVTSIFFRQTILPTWKIELLAFSSSWSPQEPEKESENKGKKVNNRNYHCWSHNMTQAILHALYNPYSGYITFYSIQYALLCIYQCTWCCFTEKYHSNEVESRIILQTKVTFAGNNLDGTISAGIYTNVCWPYNNHNYTNMEGNNTFLVRGTPDAKFQPD